MSRLTLSSALASSNGALNTVRLSTRWSPLKRNSSRRRSTPAAIAMLPAGRRKKPSSPEIEASSDVVIDSPPYSATPRAEAASSAAIASADCDWPGARNGLIRPLPSTALSASV